MVYPVHRQRLIETSITTPQTSTLSPTVRAAQLVLAHGTVLRLTELQAAIETPGRGGTLPVHFEFVRRGRLSNYQVHKFLERLANNALVVAISEQRDELYWKRRAENAQRWNRKHLVIG